MVKYEHTPGVDDFKGLGRGEAARRLLAEGYNELPSSQGRTIPGIAAGVIKEPMFLLLIAGGAIYLAIGDVEEALMLIGFVFVVVGVTIYQEQKVERALEALKSLSSPRALVVREGEVSRIPGREVVRGDIVVLNEGDRVPADSIVLSCRNLLVDESLLTGESAPVRKSAGTWDTAVGRPGGEGIPSVYSGTLVVQGYGVAGVKATGMHTEIGKIGKSLQTLRPEETPLQKEMNRLVTLFAMAAMMACAIVIVVYALSRGDGLDGVLAGLTLAMALIPEEIPVVLTIFLALGAWRLSKRRVLTRQAKAIQTLGSTTVLCVDKTGTITMNRMSVGGLYSLGSYHKIDARTGELPGPFHALLEYSILASRLEPFDPMEVALKDAGKKLLPNQAAGYDDRRLVTEYPLSNKLLAITNVWRPPADNDYVVAAKGAPEAIIDLCHLQGARKAELESFVERMAGDGLRVLGVARAVHRNAILPSDPHDFDFDLLGLVGFHDPLRPSVPEAVEECYRAGLRTVMITGDYPATALSIARQAGIKPIGEAVSGIELEGMGDGALEKRIEGVNVFFRVIPEQKLRIVNALKKKGEVVLMTGDGVNDAPALKSAHVGIAMGSRGTEVAREAASFVLLDDDFSSIVQAVKMGRRIFDNLKKAISYIFAIHVPIAGMSLLPVLLGWPIMLYPAHIAFLELIIDPVCSVVFEAEQEEKDIMKRPPRKLDEPVVDKKTIILGILQGLAVLAIVAAVYRMAPMIGEGEAQARALAFATLVTANLALVFTNRSWSRTILETLRVPNRAFLWVTAGALACLGLALYVPLIADVFRFGRPGLADLAICAAASLLCILWFEALKAMSRGKRKN